MWPAPRHSDSFWEERADAIVRAALTENENAELVHALLKAPPLPREPGDPSPDTRAKKSRSRGFIAGTAITAVGLAAAFAIAQSDHLKPPPMPSAEAPQDHPAEPSPTEPVAPREAAAKADSPTEYPATPPAPVASGKTPRSSAAARLPAASSAPETAPSLPSTAATAEAKASTEKPKPLEKSENPNAIGSENPTIDPVPADSESMSPDIPQQPSAGALNSAIRPFLPGAKKCVAGANEVSRVMVTFASSGAVKSISVTGWAEANGASGCITSALKGANVGRFWKASFTFPVTIRP